jgi:RimJ/RimL family protein N-acetyltransferase
MALEALQLFLRYATTTSDSSTTNLPVAPTSLVVRIGAYNIPSIALFQKLGFSVSKHVEVFDQVEMKFAWDPTQAQHFGMEECVNTWGKDAFTVLLYK